ncbi:hypothetical protein [Myroides sp. DW712]|uniref:hypothetical protein n=1 Tax=Myroides sp. DW712 TaxID=3389800 RepID=UPI00397C1B13
MKEELLDYISVYTRLKNIEKITSDELYSIEEGLKIEKETLENKLLTYQYDDEMNCLIQANLIDFFDTYIHVINEMKIEHLGTGVGLSINQGLYQWAYLLTDFGNQVYGIIVNGNKGHASRTLKVDYVDVVDFDVYLEFLRKEYFELKNMHFNNLLEVIQYYLLLVMRLSNLKEQEK